MSWATVLELAAMVPKVVEVAVEGVVVVAGIVVVGAMVVVVEGAVVVVVVEAAVGDFLENGGRWAPAAAAK